MSNYQKNQLWQELFACQRNFNEIHGLYLDGLGIRPTARLRVGGVGAAEITTTDSTFEITPNGLGKSALILPVYDGPIPSPWQLVPDPALIDILAFCTSEPDQFWLRRGNAVILGDAAMDYLPELDAAIKIYKNPLSWLAAAGDGIVVLDWDAAIIDLPLGHCQVTGEDLAHADEIERRLTVPPRLPNVVMPQPQIFAEAAE